jgi:hypothetical protein
MLIFTMLPGGSCATAAVELLQLVWPCEYTRALVGCRHSTERCPRGPASLPLIILASIAAVSDLRRSQPFAIFGSAGMRALHLTSLSSVHLDRG